MKKLLLLLAMMMAVTVWAQMPSLSFGNTSKDLNYASMTHTFVVAETNEGLLAVVPGTRAMFLGATSINDHCYLRMMDPNGNTLREVMLPGTEKNTVLGLVEPLTITATLVDGRAYVAYLSQGKLLRTVIDPATMQVISSEPMPDVHEGGLIYVARAFSPNRDYVAMEVAGMKSAQLLLLDETLQPLWVKNTGSYGWVKPDNKGNVYVCGDRTDQNGTHLTFIMHTADGQILEEKTNLPQVMDVKMLNADNGMMAGMALVACDEQSKKDRFTTFDRVAGISFDFDSRQIKVNMEPLSSDQLNVFANAATKKPNKVGKADCLQVHRTLATSFGGVAVVDRSWEVVTRNAQTGVTSTEYFNQGTLVMAVDMKGRILWNLPFRNSTKEGAEGQMFSKPQLFEQGDYVYFLHVEADLSPNYDIAAPSSRFNPGKSHSKHGLYCIDRQGNVTKSAIKIDGCTFGTPFRNSANSFVFFQGLMRGGLATLQF